MRRICSRLWFELNNSCWTKTNSWIFLHFDSIWVDSSCCCIFIYFFKLWNKFQGIALTFDQLKTNKQTNKQNKQTKSPRMLMMVCFFLLPLCLEHLDVFNSNLERSAWQWQCLHFGGRSSQTVFSSLSFFFLLLFRHLRQVAKPVKGIQACSRRLYPWCNRVVKNLRMLLRNASDRIRLRG